MQNDLLRTGRARRRTPPVRIGLAAARISQGQMLHDSERLALAAGDFGQRERRFAPVPIGIRFVKNAGPNSAIAIAQTKAMNRTRRKRGYPPISLAPVKEA